MKEQEKIALFIDADNAPAAKIGTILSELASNTNPNKEVTAQRDLKELNQGA